MGFPNAPHFGNNGFGNNGFGSSGNAGLSPVLDIGELGLNYDAAGGVLINDRSTVAYITDFEGNTKGCADSEIRYEGARRVENMFYNRNPSVTGSVTMVHLGDGVWEATATGPGNVRIGTTTLGNNNYTFVGAVDVKSESPIDVTLDVNDSGDITISLVSEFERFSTSGSTNNTFAFMDIGLTSGQVIQFKLWSFEDATSQSNQSPSKYLGDTIYNAGVPGVKYYDTLNANTVDVNGVVTEAEGEKIGLPIGMLHEGAYTNLCKNSEDLSVVGWTKLHVTIGVAAIEKGITLVEMIEETTVDAQSRVSRTIFQTAGDVCTVSCFAKAGTRDWVLLWANGSTDGILIRAWFNLSNGQIGISTGVSLISHTMEDMGDGVYRCSVSFSSITDAAILTIFGLSKGNGQTNIDGVAGDIGLYLGGMQFEIYSKATSYIKTEDVEVAREIDSMSIPLVIGQNFNQSKGALVFRVISKSGFPDIPPSTGLVTLSNSLVGPLYDHGSAGVAGYDGVNIIAFSVNDIVPSSGEFIFALTWDASTNTYSMSYSSNEGESWVDWKDATYDGAFSEAGVYNLFHAAYNVYNFKSLVIYDALVNDTLADTKAWLESNARRITGGATPMLHR